MRWRWRWRWRTRLRLPNWRRFFFRLPWFRNRTYIRLRRWRPRIRKCKESNHTKFSHHKLMSLPNKPNRLANLPQGWGRVVPCYRASAPPLEACFADFFTDVRRRARSAFRPMKICYTVYLTDSTNTEFFGCCGNAHI